MEHSIIMVFVSFIGNYNQNDAFAFINSLSHLATTSHSIHWKKLYKIYEIQVADWDLNDEIVKIYFSLFSCF